MYDASASYPSANANNTATLEFALERTGQDRFSGQLRLLRPGDASEPGEPIPAMRIVPAEIWKDSYRPQEMGRRLSELLFVPTVRARLATARALTPHLRLRFSFGAYASELQSLPWECLRDPENQNLLLAQDQRVFLSRYLSSFDWSPVPLRPREQLRGVIFIANPSGEEYGLAPVPVEQELKQVQAAVNGKIPLTFVGRTPDVPESPWASLDELMKALTRGCDVLYLVCHGRLDREGRSVLYLENDEKGKEGQVLAINGDVLVQRLSQLAQKPRLVVLASCDSAGSGRGVSGAPAGGETSGASGAGPTAPVGAQALLALGPRLAEAGIPAVLAMQGQVQQETIQQFMPRFFDELLKDGQVDRAVAVARGFIKSPHEAWRPVLFTRLTHGRFWYEVGFSEQDKTTEWLEALRSRLRAGSCVPIIGPGLLATLFDYQTELARHWAAKRHFPLNPRDRDNLAVVGQYLAGTLEPDYLRENLPGTLLGILREQEPALMKEVTPSAPTSDTFLEDGMTPEPPTPEEEARLLLKALQALREKRFAPETDPYTRLARLNVPCYIMASPDPLLVEALQEQKKKPREGLVPWRKMPASPRMVPDPCKAGTFYEPSVDEPLVYYLFGTLKKYDSVAITQDDFMDFLLSIHRKAVSDAFPDYVKTALNESALLYLGMPMDSLEFRTFFRLQRGGLGQPPHAVKHVAAQLVPEAGRVLDPARTQDYFNKYLQQALVEIYWGPLEQFLQDLSIRRNPVRG